MLATLIANEWDIQDTILKPHTLPLVSFIYVHRLSPSDCRQTSIASRAIDGLATMEERAAVANTLLRYFDTDNFIFSIIVTVPQRRAAIMKKNHASCESVRKNTGSPSCNGLKSTWDWM
jgi:hypothetical protein